MQKHWLLLILLAALLSLGLSAFAESEEGLVYPFQSDMPQAIADAFDPDEWQGYIPIMGQRVTRAGRDTYAHVIMEKDGHKVLCGLETTEEGTWELSGTGHMALHQDRLPTLQVADVLRFGYEFEVVYDLGGGLREEYRFFDGSKGWQLDLYRQMRGDEELTVINATPRTLYVDNEAVFNASPVLLEDFNITTFPRTLAEAQRLAETVPESNNGRALVHYSEPDDPAVDAVHLRERPSDDAPSMGLYFRGVEVEVLEERDDGWVRVRLGTYVGYMRRTALAIGGERAAIYWSNGLPGSIYVPMPQNDVSFEASDENGSTVYVSLGVKTRVQVLGLSPDLKMTHIRMETTEKEPVLALIPAIHVTQTDNMRSAIINNPKPEERLNLRTGPGKDFPSLGRYYSGQEVLFLHGSANESPWRRVVIGGVEGYMDTNFLAYGVGWMSDYLPPVRAIQDASGAHPLRKEMALTSASDLSYPNGTYAEILGVHEKWAHVRMMDGCCGYMELAALGGEPKAADPSWVTVKTDTPLYVWSEKDDVVDGVSLSAGDQVRINRRPYSYWQRTWDENLQNYTSMYFVARDDRAEVSVNDNTWGYVPWDALDVPY